MLTPLSILSPLQGPAYREASRTGLDSERPARRAGLLWSALAVHNSGPGRSRTSHE